MRSDKKSVTLDSYFIVIVATAALALTFAVKAYIYPPDKVTTEPIKLSSSSRWQKIGSEIAVINTPTTFQPLDKTFVSIPIKLSDTSREAVLTFESTDSAKINSLLIHHPSLSPLDWRVRSDGNLRIFQKGKQYASAAEILAKAPRQSILITSEISHLPQLSAVSTQVLTEESTLDGVEFIITTYEPSKTVDDGWLFERLIDASTAKIDEGNILWFVTVPETTPDTPYYIGSVHVDYRY